MNNCNGCKSNTGRIPAGCFLLIKNKSSCPCGNCLVKVICLDLCAELKACTDPQYKDIIPLVYKDGMKEYD